MKTPLRLFELGLRGLNLVDKPQDAEFTELREAQNAEISTDGGLGALDQRPGMSKINAVALDDDVLMVKDLPTDFDTNFIPWLYVGMATDSTNNWRRSQDGITWEGVDTPARPYNRDPDVAPYFGRWLKTASLRRKLYFVDTDTSMGLHSFDGEEDLTLSRVPPTVVGIALAIPNAPGVSYYGTAGSTTYTYKLVARVGTNGSVASSATSYTTAAAALSSSNFIIITPTSPPSPGATSYDVYRTAGGATQGKIGSIPIVSGAFSVGNGSGSGYVPTGLVSASERFAATGLPAGTYKYGYSFVTGSGETFPSSTTTQVVTSPSGPSAAPTCNPNTGLSGAQWDFGAGGGFTLPICYGYSCGSSLTDESAIGPASPAATVTSVSDGGSFTCYALNVQGSYSTNPNVAYVWISVGGVAGVDGTRLTSFANNTAGGTFNVTVYFNSSNAFNWGSASTNQVLVSSVPTGPSGTTQRKLYRTVAGGSQLKLLATLADNTTTTYSDAVADGSLGANAPTSDTSGLPSANIFTDAGLTGDGVAAPASATGSSTTAAKGVFDLITDGEQLYLSTLDDPATDPNLIGRILSFNPSSGQWAQLGAQFPTATGNGTAAALAMYGGALNYGTFAGVGTGNTSYIKSTGYPLPSGGVHETQTTATNYCVVDMAVFNGDFYVATAGLNGAVAALVLKRTGAGTWATSRTGPAVTAQNAYTSLYVYNGRLYAGWCSGTGGSAARIESTSDGTNWVVEQTLQTTDCVCQMIEFQGNLYVVLGRTGTGFNSTWSVKKRTPAGTWSTVDSPSDGPAGCIGVVYVRN